MAENSIAQGIASLVVLAVLSPFAIAKCNKENLEKKSQQQIIFSFFHDKDYKTNKVNIDSDPELETVYSCEGKDYTFSFNADDYTVYEVSPLVKKVIE